jgi:hypothetical protein
MALSACGSSRGFAGGGPDEMAVTRQAPLIVPPDFALVPPAPGTPNASGSGDASREALEAMFGGPAPRSSSETSTLNLAGRGNAEPGIRSSVGDLATPVVDKGATTRDIIAAPEGDGQNAKALIPG